MTRRRWMLAGALAAVVYVWLTRLVDGDVYRPFVYPW